MHKIETQIEISAPVEHVWSTLIDFASYPGWNPFIRSIDGKLEVGQQLSVCIQPAESAGMHFRPTVLVMKPNRELRWRGKLLLPGIFDGEHYFKIEMNSGKLLFKQGELFSGILVPLYRRSLDGATKEGFMAMNDALKRKAENNNG